ncbi:MAG: methyltransferase domain-containing protein [Candidatus Aenigmatarchaeota archaeon]
MKTSEMEKINIFYSMHDPNFEAVDVNGKGSSRALNFGFWADGIQNLHQAQQRLLREVVEMSPPSAGERVGDIGCGKGPLSIFLAQHYPVDVVGLDILLDHVNCAKKDADAQGLSDRIRITVGDAEMMPFLSEEMDRLFCLESAFHYPDKAAFAREAYRVLKKEGKIVLADITCEDRGRLRFPDVTFTTKDAWKRYLKEAGFSIRKDRSIGGSVYPPLVEYTRGIDPRKYPDPAALLWWKLVVRDYNANFQRGNIDYVLMLAQK